MSISSDFLYTFLNSTIHGSSCSLSRSISGARYNKAQYGINTPHASERNVCLAGDKLFP